MLSVPSFYSVLFGIVITPPLGKRELVYVLLVHLFVYVGRVDFCPFSQPLNVSVWQRFVIVALHGLFFDFFFIIISMLYILVASVVVFICYGE